MTARTDKLKAGKQRMRARLAALPVQDKLRIVEQLRDDGITPLSKAPQPSGKVPIEHDEQESTLFEIIRHTVDGKPLSREVRSDTDEEKNLAAEIEGLFKDRERALEALTTLFPEGIPTSPAFYQRLNDLHMRLGWGEMSHRATGLLLSLAIERLPQADGEALLRDFPQIRNPFFFQALESLKTFAGERTLRAEFAAEWFPALVQRIGNDLASGGFWSALGTYCEKHSRSALQVLGCLDGGKDEDQISVAAYMLGALRALDLDASIASELTRLELGFSNASSFGLRSIYYRSWIQTARRGKLSKTNLQSVMGRMSIGTAEEREQSFWIVSQCVLSPSISSECLAFGLEWLLGHASATISPGAKYHVVDLAAQLQPENQNQAADLILAVQPILPDHKGIWQRMEPLLVSLLNRDLAAFNNFLVRLVKASAQSWLKFLDDPRAFEWLRSEMAGKEIGEASAQLVFAEDSDSRKVGLLFFDKLGLTTLPEDQFRNSGERRLALAFYELQRSALDGTAIARFLILLIPWMEAVAEPLRREFYDELLLQLKNFPGSCREEFERRGGGKAILQKAVSEADSYFEALKNVYQSSNQAMDVPGVRRAVGIERRRFAHRVSKKTEEMSIFMQLFKKVRLLYGRQWSTFQAGALSEPADLQKFSHSMELPRMEFIDPEGMNLRRIHASAEIRKLSEPIGAREECQ